MVVLGCGVLYVVIYKINAIEAICEDMCVCTGDFYVFDSEEYCV